MSPFSLKTSFFILLTGISILFPAFFVIAGEKGPFDRIIQGMTIISPEGELYEDLQPLLPFRAGDRLSLKGMRKGVENLYRTGKFSNIIVSVDEAPQGVWIKLTVLERLRAGAIRWSGNKNFSRERLEEVSKLRAGDELSPGWEEKLEKILTSFYHQEGYFNIQIKIISHPLDKPNRLLVSLTVTEGEQSSIGNIYFTGETGFDQKTLLEAIRIHPGFYYSERSVQTYLKELDSLYLRAKYLKVKIKEPVLHPQQHDKVDVEIPVEAGPQIFTVILFHGPRHYLVSTLRNKILIDSEKSVDDSVLEDSSRKITEFYQNEGYPFAEVRVDRQNLSKEKIIRITFNITEGPRSLLTDVIIKGNANLSDELLRKSISHRKTGSWIPQYLRLPAVQTDLESLTGVYQSHGFLFTRVQPSIHYSQNRKEASLEFEISEGVRTMVQSVTFEGISPAHQSEIEKLVHTREKDFYKFSTVLEDKVAISTYYHKRGYADMKIEATASFSDQNDRVNIKFQVIEGKIIRIGKIHVTGNNRTRSEVILRELDFHTGDLFQEGLILKSQRKLLQLGIFQHVSFRPVNSEEDNLVRDVEVNVKERNAGAFEFGAGYVDFEGVTGFAEVSHKDIGGTGRRASLRTDVSQIGNRESLNYTEPWILNLPLDARASVYYELTQEVNANYSTKTLGGFVGIEKSLWEYYKLSLFYQNDNVHYIDLAPNQQLTPLDQGLVNIASLNPSIIRDTRDDFLNPSKGSFNAAWFRWAAQFMGSGVQEVKLTVQSSWFYPLTRNMVMAFSGRGGAAYNFGETTVVPISERFLLGGRSTVRGYAENTLGTVGQTLDANLNPLGGDSMLNFNWELRYNLPQSLGLVLFFDTGNVWSYYNSIWSSPLKSAVGPGLRYNTPVGPIRLDLGFKLNREEGESPSEFHFTLGHAF
ncbi:MAG: outer membrane protein assembly factor BamA [Nitrospiria bacterium]